MDERKRQEQKKMEMIAVHKLHTSKSTSKSLRNIVSDNGQLKDEEDDKDEERDEDDEDEDKEDEEGDDEAIEQHNLVRIFPLDFQ